MAMASDVSDARLQVAASKAGWSLAKAKGLAAKDKSLRLTPDNTFFYACNFNATNPGPTSLPGFKVQTGPDTSAYTGTPMVVNATSAFQLHSRPGAARVLYLDFKGHTTPTGVFGGNVSPIVIPAFKLSGTTSSTDQLNLNAIRDIWLHVSEDFAAWDIDVTTELPSPTARGQRCVIGGNVVTDFAPHFTPLEDLTGVMGISLMNFGSTLNGNDANNFVFLSNGISIDSPTTSNYEITILCVAHEVGHTFGLYHWGETSAGTGWAYTYGHTVTGFTGVATACPIMGSSELSGWPNTCNLNQWSKGGYPNSVVYFGNDNTAPTGTQDDIAMISAKATKLVGAKDDHGDTLATATVVSGTSVTAGGIIADSTDVDLMKITAGAGALSLTATPHLKYRNYNGNLKVGLSLLNASGTAIAGTYSLSSMGSTLTYNIPTGGTYYIKVNGLGYDPTKGTSQVPTNTGVTGTIVGTSAGFTNYGSLGRYGITGTWQAFMQAPTAIIISDRNGGIRPVAVAFDGRTSTDPDGVIAGYSWNFGDAASGAANTSTLGNPVHTYSSPGTFTASLVVTDNQGNPSAAATKVITVTGSAIPNSVSVASMTGSWVRMTNVEVAGTAVIRAVNQYGQPLRSVAVYVTVTGSASGKSAAKTDANGYVTIQMPKQRMTNPSTYTFTVTSLVYPAYTYNVLANLPSPASVTISR
jgi:PKD repeat protein